MLSVAKLTNQRPVLIKPRLRKNNIIVDKNRKNFFENFSSAFTRSTHNSVVWELQKKTIIRNQNMSYDSINVEKSKLYGE